MTRMCSGVVPQQPPTRRLPPLRTSGHNSPCIQASRDKYFGHRPSAGCRRSAGRLAEVKLLRARVPMASSMATGPTLQLQPITSAPHSSSLRRECFRVGSVEAIAVFVDGDLRHDRQGRSDIFGGQQCLMDFFQVAEGLQHEQIDAAFNQSLNLFTKGVAGLLERSFAQGFDSGSQWANRSRDPHIEAFGGFAGEPCASRLMSPTLSAKLCRPRRKELPPKVLVSIISAPDLEIVVVNAANQVGLRKVQFVVRTVDKNALGIKQRAHGAVAQHRGLLDPG